MSKSPNYKIRAAALNGAYSLWPWAGDACAYCGIFADTYDHVPPLSYVHSLGLAHFEDNGIRLYRVPACRECNSLLANSCAATVSKRRDYVKKKLRARYAKHLASAKWEPSELEELGFNLRTLVQEGADIGEWIRRRLGWAQ